MLTIRQTARGFELLRLSEDGETKLDCFDSCEDAIRRWNEIEDEIRVNLDSGA